MSNAQVQEVNNVKNREENVNMENSMNEEVMGLLTSIVGELKAQRQDMTVMQAQVGQLMTAPVPQVKGATFTQDTLGIVTRPVKGLVSTTLNVVGTLIVDVALPVTVGLANVAVDGLVGVTGVVRNTVDAIDKTVPEVVNQVQNTTIDVVETGEEYVLKAGMSVDEAMAALKAKVATVQNQVASQNQIIDVQTTAKEESK